VNSVYKVFILIENVCF